MTADAETDALEAIAARRAREAGDLARLTALLGASRKAVQRRAADLLAALAADGGEARAALAAAAAEGPARRRWGAAWALGKLGPVPQECVPVLVELLGDPDGDLRWASATLLVGRGGDPAMVATLRRLLDQGNPAQRKMALYCLRDLDVRDGHLASQLVRLANDDEAGVRLAALSALARLAPDRAQAAAAIVARLRDDADAGVRRAAASTLGRLGLAEGTVLDALAAASASADTALRRAAAGALERLGRSR